MREFEYLFEEGLFKGLRAHHKNPRNVQSLVEAHNVVCNMPGLTAYEGLGTDLRITSHTWPFPQLVPGAVPVLIHWSPTQLEYQFYEIEADFSLTLKVRVDEATFGVMDRLQWAVVENGPYQLFMNDKAIVRRNPLTDTWNATATLSTIPRCRTLCFYKGQLVGGNVQSSWHGLGEGGIVWSGVGTEDFTPNRGNVSGFGRLKRGAVSRVLRLGNTVMVYGTEMIAAMVPAKEPVPTFGKEDLLSLGIVSYGAVGGDDTQHVFIDQSGWLWSINKQLELKKLGYQEYMTKLDAEKIVICWEQSEGRYYISDGILSYILSASGLTTCYQRVKGVGIVNGTVQAIAEDGTDIELRVVTDTLDFGYRPLKTLTTFELGIDGPATPSIAVDFRTQTQRAFVRTPWVPLNWEGAATLMISVDDFRLAVRAASFVGMNLDYIKVRWKMTDLRTLRGVYAPPTSERGQKLDYAPES